MAKYLDATGSVILAEVNGINTVIEPGHPLWDEVSTRQDIEPFAPQPDPVPQSVSMFQARTALRRAGLLAAVEATVAASGDPEIQDAWEYATEFPRTSPTIAALAAQIGLTDAQVDDLFRVAATITA